MSVPSECQLEQRSEVDAIESIFVGDSEGEELNKTFLHVEDDAGRFSGQLCISPRTDSGIQLSIPVQLHTQASLRLIIRSCFCGIFAISDVSSLALCASFNFPLTYLSLVLIFLST